MSKNIKIYNRFEYYEEDCNCIYCLYYKGKKKSRKRGCDREDCCFEDIRADAIAGGRIKRKRGWNKWAG